MAKRNGQVSFTLIFVHRLELLCLRVTQFNTLFIKENVVPVENGKDRYKKDLKGAIFFATLTFIVSGVVECGNVQSTMPLSI
jgi:hypothetical protein